MLENKIIAQLKEIVGKEHVSTEKADLICYSYDATQKQYLPEVVVHPGSAEEIALIMRLANAEAIPVFPRGAGSGFTGGSLPTAGGIVLVTTRLDRILEIDEENLIATVEPGVVTGQFQKEVEKLGLFYPPDPASLKFSTLGGNVAECAGGPRCVKYGVTKDFILGLEVVTPTGEVITTGGPTMEGVVGYDLTKLMCGSEGTLGIITEVQLRLYGIPEAVSAAVCSFDTMEGAIDTVMLTIQSGIPVARIELLDEVQVDAVNRYSKLEYPVKPTLFFEFHGTERGVQ